MLRWFLAEIAEIGDQSTLNVDKEAIVATKPILRRANQVEGQAECELDLRNRFTSLHNPQA